VPAVRDPLLRLASPLSRPSLGQRREDRLSAIARKGGGDVRAELDAPVGALAVGSGQVRLDRLADQIVELGVGEDRAGAADERVDGGGDSIGKRRFFA
jgi:hypothetical protein